MNKQNQHDDGGGDDGDDDGDDEHLFASQEYNTLSVKLDHNKTSNIYY